MDIFQQIAWLKKTRRPLFADNRQCPAPALCLRPVSATPAAAALLGKWRRSHYRAFFSWIRPEENEMLAWLEVHAGDDTQILFIVENPIGTPVGQVSLYQIDKKRRCAEFGRIIKGASDGPSGTMHAGSKALLNWAFNALGLENIWLEVFADNQAAIALYRKLGFQVTEKMVFVSVTATDSVVRWTNLPGITIAQKPPQFPHREVYRMALNGERFKKDIENLCF